MEVETYRLLLVEDSAIDRRLFLEYLKDDAFVFETNYAETLSEALIKLASKHYDAVILDLGLPDSQGLNTFYSLQKEYPEVPVIIMSGLKVEELAKQAVAKGAHDYLIKGEIDTHQLIKSIKFAIQRQHVRSKIAKAFDQPSSVITSHSEAKLVTKNTPKFTSRFPVKVGVVENKDLLNSYEELIDYLIENNLRNDSQSLVMVKDVAHKAFELGLKPSQIDQLRLQQTLIDRENVLLHMLNTDIIGELAALAYEAHLDANINRQ